MKKSRTVSQFLREHLWSIMMGLLAAGGAFIWLQAQMVGVQYRLGIVEAHQAEYPSQAWFNLKFSTIEEKIDLNTIRLQKI